MAAGSGKVPDLVRIGVRFFPHSEYFMSVRPGLKSRAEQVSPYGSMQAHRQFTSVHTPCCAVHESQKFGGQVMMQAWTGAGALPTSTAASSRNRARASFLSFKRVPFRATKALQAQERGAPTAAKRAGHFHSSPSRAFCCLSFQGDGSNSC